MTVKTLDAKTPKTEKNVAGEPASHFYYDFLIARNHVDRSWIPSRADEVFNEQYEAAHTIFRTIMDAPVVDLDDVRAKLVAMQWFYSAEIQDCMPHDMGFDVVQLSKQIDVPLAKKGA